MKNELFWVVWREGFVFSRFVFRYFEFIREL